MKKETKENQLVTRGILKSELSGFKKSFKKEIQVDIKREVGKLRDELHTVEFRLDKKIDTRYYELKDEMGRGFKSIQEEMERRTDIFQRLADKVIGEHTKFEHESTE